MAHNFPRRTMVARIGDESQYIQVPYTRITDELNAENIHALVATLPKIRINNRHKPIRLWITDLNTTKTMHHDMPAYTVLNKLTFCFIIYKTFLEFFITLSQDKSLALMKVDGICYREII